MGRVYEAIDERLARMIEAQHLFFVATAALSAQGSVNLSPKGLDCFAILDPHTVAYLDLVGSGAETPRITRIAALPRGGGWRASRRGSGGCADLRAP